MKRIFTKNHIELMQKFIETNLSKKIMGDSERATRILILMDKSQLKLLEYHFASDLPEIQINQQLRSLGFLSKINLFEKRAMLTDITRRRLIKVIKESNALANTIDNSQKHNALVNTIDNSQKHNALVNTIDNSQKHSQNSVTSTQTGIVYSLLKQLFKYKLTTSAHIMPNSKHSYAEFDFKIKDRPIMYLGINRDVTFYKHFSPDVLPLTVRPPAEIKRVRLPRPKINPPKAPLAVETPDPGTVLRKKKALYYEPSVPIDYRTKQRLKLRSVQESLREWKYEPKASDYTEYNVREFIDQILFINNGIPVPTECRYSSMAEFRRNVSGMTKFRREFLPKQLGLLVLSQDKEISLADAEVIGVEARIYLTLAELEYFYGIYYNSKEYKEDGIIRRI